MVSIALRPLWHDELFTLWAGRHSLAGLLDALRRDSGPPLFYILEKPLVGLAESARCDFLIRSLPLVASLLLFLPAARLAREEGRGWFLALAACSPLLLVYGAEARAYALLALLALALFLLLFRGEPGGGRLAGAAAVAAALLWTHYLAIFLVVACALLLLARRRLAPLAALLAGSLLFLPWLPVLAQQPVQATSWMREPIGDSVLGLFSALGGAGRIPNPLGGPLPAALASAGAILGAALLVGVTLAARRRHDRESADALIVVLLTMVLILAASLKRPVAFSGRSEMVILPIWLWSVARLAFAGRALRWLAGGAVALGAAASLFLLLVPKPVPSASRAAALVTRLAGREDVVIAAAAFYLPARLAADRGRLASPLTALPSDLAQHPGWFTPAPLAEPDYRTVEEALGRLASGRRAFLLLHPFLRTPRLDRLLAARTETQVVLDRPDALVLACRAR